MPLKYIALATDQVQRLRAGEPIRRTVASCKGGTMHDRYVGPPRFRGGPTYRDDELNLVPFQLSIFLLLNRL